MSVVDQNSRGIGKGICPDVPGKALPFRINPLNGKLRVEFVPRAIGMKNVPSRMPIDANSYNVAGGLTNDSNLALTPLSVDLVGSPVAIPCVRIEKL